MEPETWGLYFNLCYKDLNSYSKSLKMVSERQTPYIKSAHWVIRRDVFDKLEKPYFDEDFSEGMFEDSAFLYRVEKETPYKGVCIPDTFVHHWGEVTYGEMGKEEIVKKNRELFFKKFGFYSER